MATEFLRDGVFRRVAPSYAVGVTMGVTLLLAAAVAAGRWVPEALSA